MSTGKFLFLFFVFSISCLAQNDSLSTKIDSLYREDQFYFTLTYNNLQKTPSGLNQNNLSPGLAVGFLRDMPVNKNRTYSVALGAGYAYNKCNMNLYISNASNGGYQYEVLSKNIYYDKSNYSFHAVEIPLELRWRNSDFVSHRFWRIYTGFKMSYILSSTYTFVNDAQNILLKNNPDVNKFQYGCYIAAGWNTWNIYAYYGFSPMFKNVQIQQKNLDMNTINIGLQFYIL